MTDLRIDAKRLLGRHRDLRGGPRSPGGPRRQPVWLRRAGTDTAAPLMLSSHVDTVVDTGIHGGCDLVLGRLEVIQTLREAV